MSKKIAIIISLIFIVSLITTSCKIHKTCPAYGKVKKANTEQKV